MKKHQRFIISVVFLFALIVSLMYFLPVGLDFGEISQHVITIVLFVLITVICCYGYFIYNKDRNMSTGRIVMRGIAVFATLLTVYTGVFFFTSKIITKKSPSSSEEQHVPSPSQLSIDSVLEKNNEFPSEARTTIEIQTDTDLAASSNAAIASKKCDMQAQYIPDPVTADRFPTLSKITLSDNEPELLVKSDDVAMQPDIVWMPGELIREIEREPDEISNTGSLPDDDYIDFLLLPAHHLSAPGNPNARFVVWPAGKRMIVQKNSYARGVPYYRSITATHSPDDVNKATGYLQPGQVIYASARRIDLDSGYQWYLVQSQGPGSFLWVAKTESLSLPERTEFRIHRR